MRVKIVKAEKGSWYENKIGDIITVTAPKPPYSHFIYFESRYTVLYLSSEHCEVLPEETPQPEPFDLDRARNGEPVITRKGAKGKYICTITKGRNNPIHVFEINTGPEQDSSWTYCYSSNGCYQSGEGLFDQTISDDESLDLFVAPKEQNVFTRWVNIFNKSGNIVTSGTYKSEMIAIESGKHATGYVKTIPFTFTLNQQP